ncbi:MAG: flagellar hook-basal body complex protein FliE [Gemmatimonadaceae bacterium]|nr:flagellar hook-basal body complex protein FliE [Gemmatimonadaceae bacterium]
MPIDRFGQFAQRVATFGLPGGDGARSVPVLPEGGTEGGGFGDALVKAINEVSAASDASSEMTGRFLRGENVELHQVMAAANESGIALDMLVELRNKVIDAYRTVMAMQS